MRNVAKILTRQGQDIGDAAVLAKRSVDHMNRAFPDARLPDEQWRHLLDSMSNDMKDRHVLAAAAAIEPCYLVTFNLKDFPEHAVGAGVTAIHPEQFLLDLLDAFPDRVMSGVAAMANRHIRPAHTLHDLARQIADGAMIPEFGLRLVEQLADRNP